MLGKEVYDFWKTLDSLLMSGVTFRRAVRKLKGHPGNPFKPFRITLEEARDRDVRAMLRKMKPLMGVEIIPRPTDIVGSQVEEPAEENAEPEAEAQVHGETTTIELATPTAGLRAGEYQNGFGYPVAGGGYEL